MIRYGLPAMFAARPEAQPIPEPNGNWVRFSDVDAAIKRAIKDMPLTQIAKIKKMED